MEEDNSNNNNYNIPLQGWGSVSPVPPSTKVNSGLSLGESGNDSPKQPEERDHDDPAAEVVNAEPIKIAVHVFPEEIWAMILTYVTDHKDRWNCANSVDMFGALLHPLGWMFFGETLPYLYAHLPRNKLLECRSVCKTWRDAVDSFLEDHPSLRPHDPARVDPRRLDFVTPTRQKSIGLYEGLHSFNFGDRFPVPYSIYEDGRRMRSTWESSPLIGRGVEVTHAFETDGLEEEDTEGVAVWWVRFFNFLEAFGTEIYYMKLDCPNYVNCVSKARYLELFNSKLFQLAPNLRSLLMRNWYCLGGSDIPAFRPGELVLPPAPHLESLHLSDDTDQAEHSPFLPFFHRYSFQLRRLEVEVHTWGQVFHLDWPLLTDLRLARIKNCEELDVDMMPAGLTYLALCLEGGVSLVGLLTFINELSGVSPRLHTLRLQGVFNFEKLPNMPSICGSVKTLELIRNPCEGFGEKSLPGAIVMASFPKIEHVHICYSPSSELAIAVEPEDGRQFYLEEMMKIAQAAKDSNFNEVDIDIEKFMYTGRTPLTPPPPGAIYKSNMWEVLPQLKVFTFQWGVFTREEYQRASSKHPTPSSSQQLY